MNKQKQISIVSALTGIEKQHINILRSEVSQSVLVEFENTETGDIDTLSFFY